MPEATENAAEIDPLPERHLLVDSDPVGDEAAREDVEREQSRLREFVLSLGASDVRSGSWFTKLCAQALDAYTDRVDWEYFQSKYAGVPADAIVDQRIKMAARYASIEGGITAAAYTGTIAATLGTLGAASPATLPAAGVTILVDMAFITQLQLRLAYDIAVLYRVPLDLSDPDDLWKLVRVAFTIKSGEFAREGVVRVVPALMRPLIKAFYKGPVLAAARGLPVVGKFLLQRNVLKIGIPLVGVPLAVVLNHYTTLVAGRHARAVFRNEARVLEVARTLSARSNHPQAMLWVAWLVVNADKKISDDEALLLRHLMQTVREEHGVDDAVLAAVVDLDTRDVWDRLEVESGDLSDIVEAAVRVAEVDGEVNAQEAAAIAAIRKRCE